jgi:hypothetical protein
MIARRQRLLLCALVCAACAPVPAAGAAGPPLASSASGRTGAVAPGGTERLITRRAGADTVVTAVSRSDGGVLRSRQIRGRWSVPAVTLDTGTTGLSADGGTLVLARPTREYPPASTRLAVLDARRLLVRRTIALRGFFTVDAISPDGRSLYVIQYAGDNVLDYRVRTLDTRTGRLTGRDVVDPRKPDEQMGGLPMTRVLSRDGRWAYTLYSGGDETFIHALDTVGRSAACIDLDMLPPDGDLSGVRLRLSADGRRIHVRDGVSLLATVDARTFAVREPGAAAPDEPPAAATAAPRPAVVAPADDSGFPWPALLLACGLAGLCALAVVFARRHARAPLERGESIVR